MGRMKEVFMEEQERRGYDAETMQEDDLRALAEQRHLEEQYYAELEQELGYWEAMAAEYDAYMESVLESGIPSHLLEVYGYPASAHIIDALPTTCKVCGDYTAPGNEYCGTECKEIYHKSISNSGTVEGPEDLPF